MPNCATSGMKLRLLWDIGRAILNETTAYAARCVEVQVSVSVIKAPLRLLRRHLPLLQRQQVPGFGGKSNLVA